MDNNDLTKILAILYLVNTHLHNIVNQIKFVELLKSTNIKFKAIIPMTLATKEMLEHGIAVQFEEQEHGIYIMPKIDYTGNKLHIDKSFISENHRNRKVKKNAKK